MERWAIYWAPARASALWTLGCQWLGRDAELANPLEPVTLPGFDSTVIATMTAEPARYGLHATLKAPFALRAGQSFESLIDACRSFATTHSACEVGTLSVEPLDDFIALVPTHVPSTLETFAFDCVRAFDPWRAPFTLEERARRSHLSLTSREQALLDAWGYPFVAEAFRFHVTLTGRLDGPARERALPALRSYFAQATEQSIAIDQIALYHEPAPSAPFRLVERFALMQ